MEFRQAFDMWKHAHQAAHEAECQALRGGLVGDNIEERQRATALRRHVSQRLRVLLGASAAAAAACRPEPHAIDGRFPAADPLPPDRVADRVRHAICLAPATCGADQPRGTGPRAPTQETTMTDPDNTLPTHASAGDPPPTAGSAADRGTTRTVVDDDEALRLPHERDESSDSGVRAPNEFMRQAGRELASGQADPPRGPATQQRYSDLTAQAGSREAPLGADGPVQRADGLPGPDRSTDDGRHAEPPDAGRAGKRAVLHRARADHAIKGEPTSGLPEQHERGRAEDVVPPPQGQTDQTR
nr:hypothetical protein [Variovorax boronicumulans]